MGSKCITCRSQGYWLEVGFQGEKRSTRKVIKHKARIVAKGCAQRERVDFDDVFVPVARIEIVMLLIAIAAQKVEKCIIWM
jgi:hypothetical protein